MCRPRRGRRGAGCPTRPCTLAPWGPAAAAGLVIPPRGRRPRAGGCPGPGREAAAGAGLGRRRGGGGRRGACGALDAGSRRCQGNRLFTQERAGREHGFTSREAPRPGVRAPEGQRGRLGDPVGPDKAGGALLSATKDNKGSCSFFSRIGRPGKAFAGDALAHAGREGMEDLKWKLSQSGDVKRGAG